jgi:hypothetical protein
MEARLVVLKLRPERLQCLDVCHIDPDYPPHPHFPAVLTLRVFENHAIGMMCRRNGRCTRPAVVLSGSGGWRHVSEVERAEATGDHVRSTQIWIR